MVFIAVRSIADCPVRKARAGVADAGAAQSPAGNENNQYKQISAYPISAADCKPRSA
jgi:hypothetical protein